MFTCIGLQQHVENYQKYGSQLGSQKGEMSPGATSSANNGDLAAEVTALRADNQRLQDYVTQYEDQIRKLENDLKDLQM